jgi:hypothetical protein
MHSRFTTFNTLQGYLAEFDDLLGRVVSHYDCKQDELVLHFGEKQRVRLYHEQDCCESVWIEDICGDLDDLIGSPLIEAEVVIRERVDLEPERPHSADESFTWTFYKFGTRRGSVTVRWFGTSNGYYSESVYHTYENDNEADLNETDFES